MSVQILNGPIIQANESLSEGIDCSAGRIVRITTPAEWDFGAPLTFQISTNGEHYDNLYLANGQEYTVIADKGRAIIIPHTEWVPGLWVKIRSGSVIAPKIQSAYREFSMVLLVEDEAPASDFGDLTPEAENKLSYAEIRELRDMMPRMRDQFTQ